MAVAYRAIPAKVPLGEARPDAVRLDDERKRIHDAIRMATWNAETVLGRMLAPHYRRAEDDAHSLLAEAFKTSADLEIIGDKLHVRLEPLLGPPPLPRSPPSAPSSPQPRRSTPAPSSASYTASRRAEPRGYSSHMARRRSSRRAVGPDGARNRVFGRLEAKIIAILIGDAHPRIVFRIHCQLLINDGRQYTAVTTLGTFSGDPEENRTPIATPGTAVDYLGESRFADAAEDHRSRPAYDSESRRGCPYSSPRTSAA